MHADNPLRPEKTIDVAHLPDSALGSQSPVWWGGLLLLLILTTFTLMMVGSYYYLMRNFDSWPPPQVFTLPTLLNPLPELTYATINLAVLVLSCVPMVFGDRAARQRQLLSAQLALTLVAIVGIAAIWLRIMEFSDSKFRWDDNAYSSLVWGLLGMHLVYAYAGTVMLLVLAVRTWLRDFSSKHVRNVTVVAMYWYWMALIWIPLYVVIYWTPRWS
jgi:cytochrome c oxidase subunit III